jgi:hypothetical protein
MRLPGHHLWAALALFARILFELFQRNGAVLPVRPSRMELATLL